ncbi:MAG TPA: peptide deformylase [Candidatus Dormibacteraeota bacterium]|nr:peptide deformylase [Candidatus Dormibacteraeota bacterium]
MTKEDIIKLPNPTLRQRSTRIGIINKDTKKLANDMILSVIDWENSRNHELGVALAAVQVNKLFRVVVVRNSFDDKTDLTFRVFINPEITKYEGEEIEDYEGCLSVPDIYGKVKRFSKIRLKALDLDGNNIKITLEGFIARILQHEIDHTNGKLFIDYIKNSKKAFYKLTETGELEQLNYDKDIKINSILW